MPPARGCACVRLPPPCPIHAPGSGLRTLSPRFRIARPISGAHLCWVFLKADLQARVDRPEGRASTPTHVSSGPEGRPLARFSLHVEAGLQTGLGRPEGRPLDEIETRSGSA